MVHANSDGGTSELLRVLLIEDMDDEAALVLRALTQSGYAPAVRRVETAQAFREALATSPWDVVISDHSLPQLSSFAALAALRQQQLDVPLIVVSATIDEDTAVSVLTAGAHDFVGSDSLARLGPAVRRALKDAQVRQAQKIEAVRQLAGDIAHDFNNLLTAILGYTDLVADQVKDQSTVAADVAEIRKAGERARSLTAQLLAVSRKQLPNKGIGVDRAMEDSRTPDGHRRR
jgi:DNA-binding response OmpR family regulator